MSLSEHQVDCKDVVFVVEASIALKGYYDALMKDYIVPAIESFVGGQHALIDMEYQFGTAQFCVLEMNPKELVYNETISFHPMMSSTKHAIECIKNVSLIQGPCSPTCPLVEGLAAALEVLEEMGQQRQKSYRGAVAKHCVVVANRDFENCKVKESAKYCNLTLDELSGHFIEKSINLSVICPRKLKVYREIFEKFQAKEPSSLEELEHTYDPSHLVLLRGFQLPSEFVFSVQLYTALQRKSTATSWLNGSVTKVVV
jgi:hypothetical protein